MSGCHKPAHVVGRCRACGNTVCALCEVGCTLPLEDRAIWVEPLCVGCVFAAEDGDPVALDLIRRAAGVVS